MKRRKKSLRRNKTEKKLQKQQMMNDISRGKTQEEEERRLSIEIKNRSRIKIKMKESMWKKRMNRRWKYMKLCRYI